MELAALLTAGRLFIALATTGDGGGRLAAPHRHLKPARRSEYGPSLLHEADADLHRASLRWRSCASGKAIHPFDPQFVRPHPSGRRTFGDPPSGRYLRFFGHERWIAPLNACACVYERAADPLTVSALTPNRAPWAYRKTAILRTRPVERRDSCSTSRAR